MNKISRWSVAPVFAAVLVLAVITTQSAQAVTFTTLYSFCPKADCLDGRFPEAGLIQATNGDLYGTTYEGGTAEGGTAFKITPGGTLTMLPSLDSDDAYPDAGLIQATNGDLYGTTMYGGADNDGSVFKITLGGTTLTTMHSFDSTDGQYPEAGLFQATNGDLYGTTLTGGAYSNGTVFKITPEGTLTTLYSFCSKTDCSDGGSPAAGLIQATNGDLYGTTIHGGANGDGTVFKITPRGTLTTLYSFCSKTDCSDGSFPYGGLIQATNGDLYGTTADGGANNVGSVFKITPGGTLTTLYSFCSNTGCTDGEYPEAGLIQATNGDLYGTTNEGGANNYGSVFKITLAGTLTTLHSFDYTDGSLPIAAMIQATNGDFYGTTPNGGAYSDGTVFRLSVGLGPFVETQTTSGKVGAVVKILGTDLAGATSVTLNGTAATFMVVSNSEITTTVPTGATTGPVEVTTPGGTLRSNVVYTVTP